MRVTLIAPEITITDDQERVSLYFARDPLARRQSLGCSAHSTLVGAVDRPTEQAAYQRLFRFVDAVLNRHRDESVGVPHLPANMVRAVSNGFAATDTHPAASLAERGAIQRESGLPVTHPFTLFAADLCSAAIASTLLAIGVVVLPTRYDPLGAPQW